MPGHTERGELFQRAALDYDRIRLKNAAVHGEQRYQVQQGAVARQAGHVDIDLREVFTEVERGENVVGIEDGELELGVLLSGALDAVGADVSADHFAAVGGEEDGGGAPLAPPPPSSTMFTSFTFIIKNGYTNVRLVSFD